MELLSLISFAVYFGAMLSLVQGAGHIYSWDIEVNQPTAGYAYTYTFQLMLEHELPTSQYLRMRWPYQIHSSGGGSDVSATLFEISPSTNQPTLLETVNALSTSENIYNFQFPTNKLLAMKWYILKISATIDASTGQSYGIKNPIYMQTVSSLAVSPLIYDENPTFAYIALAPTPGSTLGVEAFDVTGTASLRTIPGALYSKQVILTVTQSLTSGIKDKPSGANFLLSMYNDADERTMPVYKFESNSAGDCIVNQTDCNCSFSAVQVTSFYVKCLQDISLQSGEKRAISVTFKVRNPSASAGIGSLKGQLLSPSTGIMYEQGIATKIFNVNPMSLINLKINLLWGVPYRDASERSSATIKYPMPITLFSPKSNNPSFWPFNSVRFYFSPSLDCPSGSQLMVEVYLAQTDALLEGSIVHNFDKYSPTSPVKCQFVTYSKKLVCTGIASLLKTNTYFLGAKIAFLSSALSNQDNFGQITVKLAGDTSQSIVAGPSQKYDSVELMQVDDYVDNTAGTGYHQYKNFGKNQVTTGVKTGTFAAALAANVANGAFIGIDPAPSINAGVQRLLFYLKVMPDQMCPSSSSNCAAGQKPDIFIKMAYNHRAVLISDANLAMGMELNGACTSAGGTITHCKNYGTGDATYRNKIDKLLDLSSNQLMNYLNFRCINGYTECTALFSGAPLGYGLQEVTFPAQFFQQLHVDDGTLLDFVLTFQYGPQNVQETNAQIASIAVIHGYTIHPAAPTQINAAFVNWYTMSATDVTNEGLRTPTFLRLEGQLSPAEVNGATGNMLAVFFDNNVREFFAPDQYDYNAAVHDEGCGGSISSGTNKCKQYNHKSTVIKSAQDCWHLKNFVLLYNVNLQSSFTVFIPIIAKSQVKIESLVLGVVQASSSPQNGALTVKNAIRVFGSALNIANFASTTSQYWDVAQTAYANGNWDSTSNFNNIFASNNVAASYAIKDYTLIKPNRIITSTDGGFTFLAAHTDTGSKVAVNAAPKWGAGFTVTSIKNDLFAGATINTWPGSATAQSSCGRFKYYQKVAQQYIYAWFCPYDNSVGYVDGAAGEGINFVNLQIPFTWGTTFNLAGTLAYAWSAPSGQIVAFKNEAGVLGATATQTGCTALDWSPALLANTKRQKVTFTFSSSVPMKLYSADQFMVQATLNAMPTGLVPLSSCTIHSSSVAYISEKLACSYITTGPGNKLFQFTLRRTTVRSNEDPLNLLANQQFQIEFFINHNGGTTSQQTFTVQIYWNLNYLIDDGSGSTPKQVTFSSAASLPSTMTIEKLLFSIPNANANSQFSVNFYQQGRPLIEGTKFQFTLGFVATPNSLLFDNMRCSVYQRDPAVVVDDPEDIKNWQSSFIWEQIVFDKQNKLLSLYIQQSSLSSANLPASVRFRLICVGAKTPNGDLKTPFKAFWIDEANQNAVIQSSGDISYYATTLFQSSVQMSSENLFLAKKIFNTPNIEASYYFQFQPKLINMTTDSRIFLEFSSGIAPRLNRFGNRPLCEIQETSGGGAMQTVYCEQIDSFRKMVVYPVLNPKKRLVPNKNYTLMVSGILQPSSLDNYGKIWFALDIDGDLSNGVTEQGDIQDTPPQTQAISLIAQNSFAISATTVRDDQTVLTVNFTVPMRSILNSRIALLIFPPAFYSRLIKMTTTTSIQCNFYRVGDIKRQNFTSTCLLTEGGRVLKMQLINDDYNILYQSQYTLQIFYLRSPDQPTDANFPLKLDFLITDLSMQQTFFMIPRPLFTTRAPWVFLPSTVNSSMQKIDISLQQPLTSTFIQAITPVGRDDIPLLSVQRGILFERQRLYISLQNNARFNDSYTFSFSLTNFSNPLFVLRGRPGEGSPPLQTATFTINTGDSGYYLEVAAGMSVAPGYYYAEFKKTSSNPLFKVEYITPLPVLWLFVQKTICAVEANLNQFYLPIDGLTLAIYFDLRDCLPAQSIIITATLQPEQTSIWFHGPNAVVLGRDNSIYKAGFYVRANSSNVTVNDIINCTFKITGVNAEAFQFLADPYFIKIFTINKLTNNITASAIAKSPDYVASQSMTLTMSCSQPGQIFWLLAVNEAAGKAAGASAFKDTVSHQSMILKTTINDIVSSTSVSEIIYDNIYKNYFIQSSASKVYDSMLYRKYGMLQIDTANSGKSLMITDLRQGDEYSFTYFCRGQNEALSAMQYAKFVYGDDGSVQPAMLNYTKITFFFNRTLTDEQQNAILCQLHEFFIINAHMISQSMCAICNETSASLYTRRKPPFVPIIQNEVLAVRNCTPPDLAGNFSDNSSEANATREKAKKSWIGYDYYFWPMINQELKLEDVTTAVADKVLNSDNTDHCLFQDIVNATDDLDIIAAFRGVANVTSELLPYNKTIPGLELLELRRSLDFTSAMIQLVNISTDQAAFAFAALHEYTVNETYVTQPNAAQVRRGILGDGKKINFGYQQITMKSGQQYTFKFTGLTIGKRYSMYWAAIGMDDCLSNYYSSLGYNEFLFTGQEELVVFGNRLGALINTLIVCFMAVAIVLLHNL